MSDIAAARMFGLAMIMYQQVLGFFRKARELFHFERIRQVACKLLR